MGPPRVDPYTREGRRPKLPELPEVEICRRNLHRWAARRRLDAVHVVDPGAIRGSLSTRPSDALTGGAEQVEALVGGSAREPVRHGKRIGWAFGERGVLIHLGMTGAWTRTEEAPKFARLGLRFGGDWLWFKDMRRFGCVVPTASASIQAALTQGHGPDGLLAPLDGPGLAARFQSRKAIKVALLEQERIAGVGNIHAVEALWRIGLHPETPCNRVSTAHWTALAAAIPLQLEDAITAQDGEEFTYITDGGPNVFTVYGREGSECPRCGAAIHKSTSAGRATFHCPTCQPDDRPAA